MLEQTLQHPNTDRNRIYVMGFSMGSFGTWDIIADYPNVFAAAVPIAGASSSSLAEKLANVPIWAIHGGLDKACPVEDTREMIQAMKNVGGQPRFTELPGVGHGGWHQAFLDSNRILDWMFEQRRTDD